MRITPSVHIVGSTVLGLTEGFDCYIYLVKGPDGIFLIDAGNGYDTEGVLRNIRNEGFDPKDITHILITHHHTDHARGAKALKDAIGCEVWIGANTGKHLLQEGTDEELGIPYAKAHGMYAQDYYYIHCPVEHAIEDGETFTIGGLTINAINVIGPLLFGQAGNLAGSLGVVFAGLAAVAALALLILWRQRRRAR